MPVRVVGKSAEVVPAVTLTDAAGVSATVGEADEEDAGIPHEVCDDSCDSTSA